MKQPVPGYDIKERIYSSSKTWVYRANDLKQGQAVIIKCLRSEYPSQLEIDSLSHSSHLAKSCQHPQILAPLAIINSPDLHCLVYEDLGLIDLNGYLTQQPHHQLSTYQFLVLAIQIADIFACIHEKKLIFKDLHPGNLLVDPKTRQIYISDFELATQLRKEHAQTQSLSEINGVLGFISPEQTGRINRPIDYRTDIYSIGACFFQMLTAQRLFSGVNALEIIHQHIAKTPAIVSNLRPDIPQVISNIVSKLLEKSPEDRYQNALGLKHDLQRCLSDWESNARIESFTIAEKDFSETLELTHRLYGRKADLQRLQKAYKHSTQRQLNIVTISGPAGIGKSTFVKEIKHSIFEAGGLLLHGKFDQYHNSQPYSVITYAFQEWVKYALCQSSDQLKHLRKELHNTLGKSIHLLSGFSPDIKPIIGDLGLQNPETINDSSKVPWVFQQFLDVITRIQPIALFVDDLQWADDSSIDLLNAILEKSNIRLLLILGFRDHEITSNAFAYRFINALSDYKNLDTLTLKPLSKKNTNALLADTFRCSEKDTAPLADLVHVKTGGNPLFIQQFLQTLHERQLIYFNKQALKWKWDLGSIQEQKITDNLASLIIDSIKSLPETTLRWLTLASSIGQSFNSQFISLTQSTDETPLFSIQEIEQDLVPAVNKGILITTSHSDLPTLVTSDSYEVNTQNYRFSHDRIYQEIYHSVAKRDRSHLHLQIASSLLPFVLTGSNITLILTTAEHYQQADTDSLSAHEKVTIAKLLLTAASHARLKGLQKLAYGFTKKGCQLLPQASWSKHYQLTLGLKRENLICNLSTGGNDDIEADVKDLSAHIKDKKQLADLIYLVSNSGMLTRHADYTNGLAIQMVSALGIDIQITQDQVLDQVIKRLESEVSSLNIGNLAKSGWVSDSNIRIRQMLLCQIAYHAYISGKSRLFDYFCLLAMREMINHGLTASSGIIYCLYIGHLLFVKRYGDIKPFQKLAIDFLRVKSRQPNFSGSRIAQAYITIGSQCLPHTDTLENSNQLLEEGYQRAIEEGEPNALPGLYGNTIINGFAQGLPLTLLEEKLQKHSILVNRYNPPVSASKLYTILVDLLRGKTDESALYKEAFTPLEWEQISNSRMHSFIYHLRFQYYFWVNDYKRFLETELAFKTLEKDDHGFISHIEGLFIRSLMHCRHSNPTKGIVTRTLDELHVLAKLNPQTFSHKYYLLKIEIEIQEKSNIHELITGYRYSIELAQKNGFIQYQAYANERLADFLMASSLLEYAKLHLKNAKYLYDKWDCTLKVADINTRLASMPSTKSRTREKQTTRIPSFISSSKKTKTSTLDLSTLIKATHFLAHHGESLTDVIEKILHATLENSGAQGAALLFNDEGTLQLKSTVNLCGKTIPNNIINYVYRTEAPLIIKNLSKEPSWLKDPYFSEHRPKSILCTPIVYRDAVTGIIYLENQLLSQAFTPGRLKLISMLMAQVAITLENAKQVTRIDTYNRALTTEIDARTADLNTTHNELAAFGYAVAHDLKSPLRKINGFSEAMIEDCGRSITGEARSFIDRILKNGEKMNDLINGLSALHQFSYDEIKNEQIDLRKVIDSIITDLSHEYSHHAVTININDLGTLTADYRLIRIVFLNLLSNAWKYTQGVNQAHVEVGSFYEDKTKIYYIKDNGVGFNTAHAKSLFLSFQRLHSNKDFQGSGIGLATVKRIIDRYEGKIWFESEPNKGATFFFHLSDKKLNPIETQTLSHP